MRGSLSKTLIGTAILQVFPNSFVEPDGKTIRIPTTCEGQLIEVKIQMTAAKDVIGGQPSFEPVVKSANPQNTAMTDAEIAEVKELIARLGL
jgi:hypothetical protein